MAIPAPEASDRTLNELLSLKGRRAVVTGGGRGLGKAIAARLAEAGADLLIGDLDEESARQTAECGRPYAHLFAGGADPSADPHRTQPSEPMLALFVREAAA